MKLEEDLLWLKISLLLKITLPLLWGGVSEAKAYTDSKLTWNNISGKPDVYPMVNKEIFIEGDSNYYYPTWIQMSDNKELPNFISIHKNLGSLTPAYPGNHSTSGASMWLQYEGRKTSWDGNGGYVYTKYYSMPYANLVSNVDVNTQDGGIIVYLRGGGCQYTISSNYNITITTYYTETNIQSSTYPWTVAPRNTTGNLGMVRYGGNILPGFMPKDNFSLSGTTLTITL